MPAERLLQSKIFRGVILGFGVGAGALIVFAGGMAVGSRKALFACNWNDNYRRNFGDHAGMFPPGPAPFQGHMVGVHGVLGTVVSVMDDSIVVQGKDGVERGVVIQDGTNVRRGSEQVTSDALKAGETVMTFGEPDNDGRIQAKLIRILQ